MPREPLTPWPTLERLPPVRPQRNRRGKLAAFTPQAYWTVALGSVGLGFVLALLGRLA